MNVKIIETNKIDFLDLLLLADEQEDMIDKQLERGMLFALYDDDLKSVCVVTDEGEGNFIEHYAKPMFEDGIQLNDKVYLKRNL